MRDFNSVTVSGAVLGRLPGTSAKSSQLGCVLPCVKFPKGRAFKDEEFAPALGKSDVLEQAETAQ
jgi:hypothetical protein